jgi:hypothetical protein
MIDNESIRALLRSEHNHAVSIFLPTHVAGREIRQDPIRFRSLLDAAAARLLRAGMGKSDIETMLAPAYKLAADESFWRQQEKGLAVFVAPGFCHHEKAPVEFPEEVVLGRHFHVKHFLPLMAEDGRFWILMLSARRARLFEASRHSCRDVTPEDMPRGLEEIVAETDYEPTVQRSPAARPRTGGPAGAGARGAGQPGDSPQSHSFEDREGVRKAELLEYLHRVVARIADEVKAPKAPLVLIAKPEARGNFKTAAEHLKLEIEDLDLNPDAFSPSELHEKAWEVVRHHFTAARAAALDHFNSLIGTGDQKATLKPEEIVKAARYGRVDTLFVAADEHLWGRFDEAQDQVVAHGHATEEDEDLLDYAAGQTILQGGRVELLPKDELPRNGLMAAILRY